MLLSEPVFKGVLWDTALESFQPQRPSDLEDESVGSFISRRFGSSLADNIASAVFHGIYAGDIYQLSARSILPKLWVYEQMHSSIMIAALNAATRGFSLFQRADIDLMQNLTSRLNTTDGMWLFGMDDFNDLCRSSAFTFKQGIGQLASRIENLLQSKPNVKIYKNTNIGSLQKITQEGSKLVCCSGSDLVGV